MKRGGFSLVVFFCSAAAAFLLDLLTKLAVVHWLRPGSSIEIFGNFARLTHVRNIGASFGLFPGNTYPLIAISSVAVIIVLVLAMRSKDRTPVMLCLGLILGGALGNLYDRLRLGEVIDFLDIGVGSRRWPVFNVADIAVTLGVLVLLVHYLRDSSKPGVLLEADQGLSDETKDAQDLGSTRR